MSRKKLITLVSVGVVLVVVMFVGIVQWQGWINIGADTMLPTQTSLQTQNANTTTPAPALNGRKCSSNACIQTDDPINLCATDEDCAESRCVGKTGDGANGFCLQGFPASAPGTNCTTNWKDCTLPEKTHKACVIDRGANNSGTCRLVPGEGPDLCDDYNNSDDCNVRKCNTGIYNKVYCSSYFAPGGIDECATDEECGHRECIGLMCELLPGKGTSTCDENDPAKDCHHGVCAYAGTGGTGTGYCVQEIGGGVDKCSDTNKCPDKPGPGVGTTAPIPTPAQGSTGVGTTAPIPTPAQGSTGVGTTNPQNLFQKMKNYFK